MRDPLALRFAFAPLALISLRVMGCSSSNASPQPSESGAPTAEGGAPSMDPTPLGDAASGTSDGSAPVPVDAAPYDATTSADAASDASVRDSAPPASYTNRVIDQDFPDPMVMRASDGTYYAFATQGALGNIQSAKSTDLIHWTTLGDALPNKPSWGTTSQSFWAPHVVLNAGTYYLYFASDQDAASGKCIGVATSATPEGPYQPTAAPIMCNTGFIDIDPMVFDDAASGKTFLYWGSNSAPISVQELAADRVSLAAGSSPQALLTAGSGAAYQNLLEGAWLTERAGTYYLFYSGDDCCGSSANGFIAHYAIMVARASSPTGPFTPYSSPTVSGSSVIVAANAAWDGPGHNAVVRDANGEDWLVYHGIDTTNRTGGGSFVRRPMLLDPLVYVDGWPTVAGASPSTTSQVGPATQ